MTERLVDYLMYATGDNKERKDVLRRIPRALSAFPDEDATKPESVRELLLHTDIEDTTLIQTEVMGTILEGVQPAKCMRQALSTTRCMGDFTWVIGEAGRYASRVAEGAEIPIRVQEYSTRSFTVYKYGERPLITKEMVDDSKFGVIEQELKATGNALENTLNQVCLTNLLDNAGNEHDTTGSNQGSKAILGAIHEMKVDGLIPDTLIMTPDFEYKLMLDYTLTAYAGAESILGGGLPPVFGLKPYSCNVTDASSTYTWDYDTDGEIGALVLDRNAAASLAIRDDVGVERYKDPIRDLVGMSVTTRYAINYLHANAICRIEY